MHKIAIIGLGLIGGSMGMAMVGKGLVREVWGVDVDPITLETALQTMAVHKATTQLAEGVRGAEMVVLAVPVGLTEEVLKGIAPYLSEGCIVTDVGSTKTGVVELAEGILPSGVHFVGGHPMAGSEVAGIKGADRYLFENAVYLLTPTDKTDRAAADRVQALMEAVGAKVFRYSPKEHDVMVAAVSHLPQLLAVALVKTVAGVQEKHRDTLLLAAGGFRDTTRIASSHPVMWRDIFLSNKDSVLEMVGKFRLVLDEFEEAITASNGADLMGQLEAARQIRQGLPDKAKGYLPSLHEIIVTVPDRPGMIAEIATHLGAEGININDIEILRIREGDGGTIRLGLTEPGSDDRAVEILRSKGIVAKKK
ncbi:MAG: prephenate dehydrogenase [Clostridia bacterium]|nr:prephenate dehydrogenase [Clostridia bacterium]